MNCLFTVCGRAGSKGIKNKNCRNFLGVPLLHYTLAAIALFSAGNKDDIIHTCINTDSDLLLSLARDWSPDIFAVNRPAELAGDRAAKMPVIRHTLREMEASQKLSYDHVVDLDITSPLRTVADIAAAIEKRKSSGFDVVFSVTEARRSPYFNMVTEKTDGSCEKVLPSNFTARQQAPVLYDVNASIYAYDPQFLRGNTSGMLFDGRCGVVKMPDTGVLDLDSERDFYLMEAIAAHLQQHDEGLSAVMEAARKGRAA